MLLLNNIQNVIFLFIYLNKQKYAFWKYNKKLLKKSLFGFLILHFIKLYYLEKK